MAENTAYVFDENTIDEMARLMKQDQVITKWLGGLLPERSDFAGIYTIADVACGPGGWAMEIALRHPQIEVHGLDKSKSMIQFAQSRALQLGVNVTFQTGDATQFPLPYPSDYFHLTHVRLVHGFMPHDLWPAFIQELTRITAPGGFVKVVEEDAHLMTNSPALAEYNRLIAQALYHAKKSFYPDYGGLFPRLNSFLSQAGLQNIQRTDTIFDHSRNTAAYQSMVEDYKIVFKTIVPLLLMFVPEEQKAERERSLQNLYNQLLDEFDSIRQKDGSLEPFSAQLHFATFFAQKPVI